LSVVCHHHNHETLHLSPNPGIGDIARLANESALMPTIPAPRTPLGSLIAAGVIAVAAMTALARSRVRKPKNKSSPAAVRHCDTYIDDNYTQTFGPNRQTRPIEPVTGSTPPVAPPITNLMAGRAAN
jgi:hypothetical protein